MAAAVPVLEERKVVWKTAVAIKWVTHTVTAEATSTTSTAESTTSSEVSTTSAETTTSTPPPAPVETTPPAPVIPDLPAILPIIPEVPPLRELIPDPVFQAPEPQAPAPVQQAPASGDYAETMLYHHNVHRSNHSSGALSWSGALASYAAQTASKCVFAHDLSPGGGGYGQNLAFWGGSQGASFGINRAGAQAASNMWYNGELNLFPSSDYGKSNPGGNFADWGHFSQLIWAGTTEVGCVSHVCPAGTLSSLESIYTVCNYSPAGNMGGQYGNNVRAPQGQPGVVAS